MVNPSAYQKRGLYLFSNDLRLEDNPALNHLISQCDALIFLYIIDPAMSEPSHRGFPRLSLERWQFIWQSLRDLHQHLQRYGHRLHLVKGEPEAVLNEFCQQHRIDLLAGSYNSGLDEYRFWQRQQAQQKTLSLHQNSLFTPEFLPVPVDSLPCQFTPFRKLAEQIKVPHPVVLNNDLAHRQAISSEVGLQKWPTQPPLLSDYQKEASQQTADNTDRIWQGGSQPGWQQLDQFIWKLRHIDHYKQTRNALDTQQQRHDVSQLSPWLAQGCLSPRQVWAEIERYEQQYSANDSTYWLKFELLWREFFYWEAHKLGPQLYRFGGRHNKKPLTSFYPQRFKSWCEGTTPYPIVNACMKQLKATGMLSNRGRQIVASALVNELEIDWRYGAAWFEYQLLDYDPGSNYGNWQYIAGVGADPRGGRHFNLQKQTDQFDPDGAYIRRWQAGFAPPMDAVGIDDWPEPPSGRYSG